MSAKQFTEIRETEESESCWILIGFGARKALLRDWNYGLSYVEYITLAGSPGEQGAPMIYEDHWMGN